ncbi:hypothetical protein [Nereida sp. MMG025]|uniref:COG3904 family protein n=1 Tax=Nereida sp. MMG025 TaxID=2909981 RepID=UPI001F43530A|nr:hypothetical protein [Nereida sp. MMG025]MCF6445148.1 hypothetical protein [Nereida sp. MMG025]
MSDAKPDRFRPARVLRGLFVAQLGIGALLVAADLSVGLPQLFTGTTRAPALTQPVAPGDQTRRYRPSDVPTNPYQGPNPGPMPSRLTFDVVDDTLRLTGDITSGDADRFAEYLAENGDLPDLITLHSPGGSVRDALAIGRMVRGRSFDTQIVENAVCFSACPYIFMAGTTRVVDGALGVHQHYFGEDTILPAWMAVSDIQRGQAEVMGYLDDMGIDPLVMRHALATPPDAIYVLVPEELERYRVVTN